MSMTVIRSIDPRSPAQRAGLEVGETLTHVNDHPSWMCWTISFTPTIRAWS